LSTRSSSASPPSCGNTLRTASRNTAARLRVQIATVIHGGAGSKVAAVLVPICRRMFRASLRLSKPKKQPQGAKGGKAATPGFQRPFGVLTTSGVWPNCLQVSQPSAASPGGIQADGGWVLA
jgi:hypothetical protein